MNQKFLKYNTSCLMTLSTLSVFLFITIWQRYHWNWLCSRCQQKTVIYHYNLWAFWVKQNCLWFEIMKPACLPSYNLYIMYLFHTNKVRTQNSSILYQQNHLKNMVKILYFRKLSNFLSFWRAPGPSRAHIMLKIEERTYFRTFLFFESCESDQNWMI